MSKDIKFVDGAYLTRKETAPEYIITDVSYKVDMFKAFLDANVNEKGWVNTTLKWSKDGKMYFQLNDYVAPKPTVAPVPASAEEQFQKERLMHSGSDEPVEEIKPENIPF